MELVVSFIDSYTLLLNCLAGITYWLLVRRFTAFSVMMIACIILNVLHVFIADYLSQYFGVKEYERVIVISWYLSFAITNLICVLCVKSLIVKFNLLKDKVTTFLMGCYLFLSLVQILRFGDRAILNTDYLDASYEILIVLVNVLMTLAVCLYSLRAALAIMNSKLMLFIGK